MYNTLLHSLLLSFYKCIIRDSRFLLIFPKIGTKISYTLVFLQMFGLLTITYSYLGILPFVNLFQLLEEKRLDIIHFTKVWITYSYWQLTRKNVFSHFTFVKLATKIFSNEDFTIGLHLMAVELILARLQKMFLGVRNIQLPHFLH